MAFPVAANWINTNGSTATTSPVVSLPSGITAGQLLLIFIRNAAGGTITWPAGWDEVFEDSSDASNDTTALAKRVADGNEGGSVTLTNGFSASGKFAAVAYRITGADSNIQTSSVNTGTSANPDSPSFSPTGGAKDYLWFSLAAQEGEAASWTDPTGYSAGDSAQNATSGTGGAVATNCSVGTAFLQSNTATEDPGTWTFGVSDDWSAWTVAVPPAAPAAALPILGARYRPHFTTPRRRLF